MNRQYLKSFAIVIAAASAGLAWGLHDAKAPGAPQLEARVKAAVSKVAAACQADLQKYCGTVTPGDGRILLCIEAHEDKISTKCDYALFEASRNLDRALDRVEMTAAACWADIEKSCTDIAVGNGGVARCLTSKKASLSQPCRSQIDTLQAAK